MTFPLNEMYGNSRLCDRLRSSAIIWKQVSLRSSAIRDRLRSFAIIWKPAFNCWPVKSSKTKKFLFSDGLKKTLFILQGQPFQLIKSRKHKQKTQTSFEQEKLLSIFNLLPTGFYFLLCTIKSKTFSPKIGQHLLNVDQSKTPEREICLDRCDLSLTPLSFYLSPSDCGGSKTQVTGHR